MLNTSQYFQQITRDLPKALRTTASKSLVKREVQYFLDNIEKVKSPDAFIENWRLFHFAMKAFGMEDMTYAKALVRKALVEGVDSENSFANRLVDNRLKDLVSTFNFARRGEYATEFAEAKEGTVDRYIRQTLEEEAGKQNEGVRLALYFERKASTLSSAYSILADKALLQVVQTALDIPASASSQDIDKQAALIEKRLPISSLKTPAKLASFLRKFTVQWEMANPSSKPMTPTLPAGTSMGISSSVLAALQNLKLGGN